MRLISVVILRCIGICDIVIRSPWARCQRCLSRQALDVTLVDVLSTTATVSCGQADNTPSNGSFNPHDRVTQKSSTAVDWTEQTEIYGLLIRSPRRRKSQSLKHSGSEKHLQPFQHPTYFTTYQRSTSRPGLKFQSLSGPRYPSTQHR